MAKQFDLYKWIILGSLVAMPAAGGWLYWLHKRIDEGTVAVRNAKRPQTGELQTIGRLISEITNQAKSAGAVTAEDPRLYFDRQISGSSSDLKRTDYNIEAVAATPNKDTRSIDRVFKIEFKREGKAFALTRELVQAVLFNCEAKSPAWRLRSLRLVNEETRQITSSGGRPPNEVADNWFVEQLLFARREPDNTTRRATGK